jgi:hypothetical protein
MRSVLAKSTSPQRNERRERLVGYRARAHALADRAASVHAPELRVAYLELAQQWAALADHVDHEVGGPDRSGDEEH